LIYLIKILLRYSYWISVITTLCHIIFFAYCCSERKVRDDYNAIKMAEYIASIAGKII